jgi:hypothetical protein
MPVGQEFAILKNIRLLCILSGIMSLVARNSIIMEKEISSKLVFN